MAIYIRFAKFCIAGLINTGIDFIVFYIIIHLLLNPYDEILGKVCGALAGITSAFILNSVWVFRKDFMASLRNKYFFQDKLAHIFFSFLKILLTYSAGAIINIIIFTQLRRIDIIIPVSLVIATLASLVFNYFFSKKFVYSNI